MPSIVNFKKSKNFTNCKKIVFRVGLEQSRNSRVVRIKDVISKSKGWCPEAESNHRHEDFQSSALPTELSGLNDM